MALWENLLGESSLEKPVSYLRKTYLEEPTILLGKTFRKTRSCFWEKPILSVLRVGRYL